MAVTVAGLGFAYPGAEPLFFDVSFKVGDGVCAGIVGDNAVGKSTLLKILAGVLQPVDGEIHIDGDVRRMSQAAGQDDPGLTVRGFLLTMVGGDLGDAGIALAACEQANADRPTTGTGMALASAISHWGDLGGYEVEASWDAATTAVLRQPLAVAGARPVSELSGGERKRLALETLFRSDATVLLLDEPDNFLDIPGKRWLEDKLRSTAKTVLMISHDREILARAVDRVITIEGAGAWVHGGSFAGYHEARTARNEHLGDALERWRAEERRLYRYYKTLKQRASISEAMAARADAAESRWRRFVAVGPPPAPPPERPVDMRLRGGDSGRRALRCTALEIEELTLPFDVDVHYGERMAVLGPNGVGKSHFLRLISGGDVAHTGGYRIGARVSVGYFNQTNAREDLTDRTPLEVMAALLGNEEKGMRALARYGLAVSAGTDFSHLSGGQQARLQILTLEAGGANLLLLDEPTDNLDLVSAEALEEALDGFRGTVLAVTHDRWLMRGFDRFVVFDFDGSVSEALDLETALAAIGDTDLPNATAHLVSLLTD